MWQTLAVSVLAADLTEQLVPDVEVPMSSADYLSGFDPVLEAALAD